MTRYRGCFAVFAVVLLTALGSAQAWAQDDAASAAEIMREIPVEPAGTESQQLLRNASGGGGACCPIPEGCACPTTCLESPIGRVPCLDDCIDKYRAARATTCLKISAGAYHWWNYNLDSEKFRYGYENPGISLPGTYFYFLMADLECEPCGCITYGAHIHARFREETSSRPWINETAWFQQAYVYAKAPAWGTLKLGKINYKYGLGLLNAYGLDSYWDDSFWGNVPYFNGIKFNSEWGLSWEHDINWKRLTMPFSAQVFFGEDEYNGSFGGGDAESSAIYDQEITGVARIQPTWHIDTNTYIRLGLSGLVGSLSNSAGSDETRTSYAVDLTFKWCGFQAWAEYTRLDGTVHEAHYVTGGPSDEKDFLLFGASYQLGPFKPRVHYSYGDYKNPGGDESILIFGLDVQLTSWLLLQVEYIDWVLQPAGGAEFQVEDGLQFVLLWYL